MGKSSMRLIPKGKIEVHLKTRSAVLSECLCAFHVIIRVSRKKIKANIAIVT